jgi:nitroreductase
MDRSQLVEFVRAGIAAPSADNLQPWRFALGESSLELRLDPTYLGAFVDPLNYASLLSAGGVVENIRLTAQAAGFAMAEQRLSAAAPDYVVARLDFAPAPCRSDPAVEGIFRRCTHRGAFKRDVAVAAATLDQIERMTAQHAGTRIVWAQRERLGAIRSIVTRVDRLRFTNREMHEGFYKTLRFGRAIEASRDGLAADTLALEWFLILTLRALRPWWLARAGLLLGTHYFSAFRGTYLPLMSAPCVGALLMPRNADYVTCGQALQRCWLAVNRIAGLHYQPLGALPLLLFRLEELCGEGLDARERSVLRNAGDALQEQLQVSFTSERLVMLFRIGYAEEPRARGRRRPLERFLISQPAS